MRKLGVFNFITLNGFYAGIGGDISWHPHTQEGNDFAIESQKSGSTLLFGRVTYQLMASYWPTPMAAQNNPAVAENMNKAQKIVFSRTLHKADWQNTILIKDSIVDAIRKLKQEPGSDLTILGSGSIVNLFAEHGLIDSYSYMVDPVALGAGSQILTGLTKPLNLKLTGTRIFKNGSVLLNYEAIK